MPLMLKGISRFGSRHFKVVLTIKLTYHEKTKFLLVSYAFINICENKNCSVVTWWMDIIISEKNENSTTTST